MAENFEAQKPVQRLTSEEGRRLFADLAASGVEMGKPVTGTEDAPREKSPEPLQAEGPDRFTPPSPEDASIRMTKEELARGLEEERLKAAERAERARTEKEKELREISEAIGTIMDEAEGEKGNKPSEL
jgi:hypothetical protein